MKVTKGELVYETVRGKGVVLDIKNNIIKIEFITYVQHFEYLGYYNLNGVIVTTDALSGPRPNRSLFKYKKYMKILKHIDYNKWLELKQPNIMKMLKKQLNTAGPSITVYCFECCYLNGKCMPGESFDIELLLTGASIKCVEGCKKLTIKRIPSRNIVLYVEDNFVAELNLHNGWNDMKVIKNKGCYNVKK